MPAFSEHGNESSVSTLGWQFIDLTEQVSQEELFFV
jgi:hypothetical protein